MADEFDEWLTVTLALAAELVQVIEPQRRALRGSAARQRSCSTHLTIFTVTLKLQSHRTRGHMVFVFI